MSRQAFGPISEILLDPITFPPCGQLNAQYNTDICLRINVEARLGYWLNVATIACMAFSGFDGSPTHKYIHRRLFPADAHPPPTWCREG